MNTVRRSPFFTENLITGLAMLGALDAARRKCGVVLVTAWAIGCSLDGPVWSSWQAVPPSTRTRKRRGARRMGDSKKGERRRLREVEPEERTIQMARSRSIPSRARCIARATPRLPGKLGLFLLRTTD